MFLPRFVWLLHVKTFGRHVNFKRDLTYMYSRFHEHSKIELLLIFTFYYKYYYIEIIYNLGTKTVLYLICNRINGFVGV